MPARKTRKSRSTATRRFVLAVLLVCLLAYATGSARGDTPIVTKDEGSHTVTWTFATETNLTATGLDFATGRVVLPWEHSEIAWDAEDFGLNGNLGEGLTVGAGGIELSADSRNPLVNADFVAGTGWQFVDGPEGHVSSGWDPAAESAVLGHDRPASETEWDSMDDIVVQWFAVSPVGASLSLAQGPGRMEMGFETTTATFVAARRTDPVDWSSGDRLVVRVNATNAVLPVSFNLTATIGGATRTTPAIPLVVGWQELSIDLTPLGDANERAALEDLSFRLNAQGAPWTLVFFDDARLGTLNRFDEEALLVQTVEKANGTTPSAGSAYLAFDWAVSDATGILMAEAAVSLTGPSGSFEQSFAGSVPSDWETFSTDVSSSTSSAGNYLLSFRYRLAVEGTAASRATLRVDNVSLRFPDRDNATFVSEPIDLGRASEFLSVSWSASLPPETSARLKLRSGNETDPGTASWSPWADWSSPGVHSLSLPGAHRLQLGLDLNTTNASRSPVVGSFTLETRHRAATGFVEADAFTALPGFVRWRSLHGYWTPLPGTDIEFEFEAGDGSYWSRVPATEDIGTAPERLRWRATLSTSDGLFTPQLERVEAVYELDAPILGIVLPYSIALVAITAGAWIVHELVIRRMFSIDDVFLISRDGRLLMHNTRRLRADRDEDILSAMLSAILSFVRDADPEENGDLRRFQLGGKTTLLERGKDVFVCVVYSGRVPRWAPRDLRRFVADLDAEFGEAFSDWNGAREDLPDIKEFTKRFVLRVRYRSPRTNHARPA